MSMTHGGQVGSILNLFEMFIGTHGNCSPCSIEPLKFRIKNHIFSYFSRSDEYSSMDPLLLSSNI